MLHFHTQIAMLYKVQARANIDGNEQHDKLTKMEQKQAHKNVGGPYEHAHSTHTTFKRLVALYAQNVG